MWLSEDGALMVADRGSSNGTMVVRSGQAFPISQEVMTLSNGDMVHLPTQMRRDDVLEVGQTKLVLVPFCGEKYSWSETSES